MGSLADIKLGPPKILLYGPPGGGKTVLAATLGQYCKYFDLDVGIVSAAKTEDKWKSTRFRIDVEVLSEDDPLNRGIAYPKFKSKLIDVVNLCAKGEYKFQSLVVDSLTTLGEYAMRYILGNAGRIMDKAMNAQPPQIQDWGLAMNEVQQCINLIRSLPIPVILIAHHTHLDIDEKKKTEVWVIGNKLAPKLPAYFDEVWYLEAKSAGAGKLERKIQTQPTSSLMARTRRNLPNDTNVDLGMVEILKLIGWEFKPT